MMFMRESVGGQFTPLEQIVGIEGLCNLYKWSISIFRDPAQLDTYPYTSESMKKPTSEPSLTAAIRGSPANLLQRFLKIETRSSKEYPPCLWAAMIDQG